MGLAAATLDGCRSFISRDQMGSEVHERGDAAPLIDHPLVHCFAGNQIVLAYISRQALMD
jgi:hypothetical protein